MAAEGDLNKSNGDIWYAGDVTALLNSQASIFKDTAQLLYNSAYIGFNSKLYATGSPNLKNIKYSITTGFSDDTTENEFFKSVDDYIIFSEALDLFNDGSFNISNSSTTETNSVWTATTVHTNGNSSLIEGTGAGAYINLSSDNANLPGTSSQLLYADQASAPNLNQECEIIVDLRSYSASSAGNSGYSSGFYLALRDGSTDVNLLYYLQTYQNVTTTNLTGNGLYRIKISPADNKAYVYPLNTPFGTPSEISISGLADGNAWRLKIYNYATSNNMESLVSFYSIKIIPSDGTESTWVSKSLSTTETVTNAIATFNIYGNYDSIKYYLTADGTNWEEVTDSEIHRFTNTGTSLSAKVITTLDDQTDVSQLTEYAIKYNLY